MTQISSKLAVARQEISGRIAIAARAAGRAPEAITLIAVSKQQSDDRIADMISTGQLVFGENRVQEAQAHWQDSQDQMPGLKLHLIGPLQTNKALDAVTLFDVIETLDRPKLAAALTRAMDKAGRQIECFVQVNTGEEPQKAGLVPQEVDGFIADVRETYGIEPKGLMCIPPVGEEPAMHFALLRKIARRNGIAKLSMGMSHDFETAIAFGATHVRVGTALFGPRG
ncbi:MAG: YggS family pyridoxal phosphate-dependent enzyme [Robiginitomaculum sp.]|nr:MAG: YggS family pyridoxal phosphate-dependent enzyme [Robiginitomaculum sp.]